jgi:hypothetical protein
MNLRSTFIDYTNAPPHEIETEKFEDARKSIYRLIRTLLEDYLNIQKKRIVCQGNIWGIWSLFDVPLRRTPEFFFGREVERGRFQPFGGSAGGFEVRRAHRLFSFRIPDFTSGSEPSRYNHFGYGINISFMLLTPEGILSSIFRSWEMLRYHFDITNRNGSFLLVMSFDALPLWIFLQITLSSPYLQSLPLKDWFRIWQDILLFFPSERGSRWAISACSLELVG